MVQFAASNRANEYVIAEQVVTAVATWTQSIGDNKRIDGAIDFLFQAVIDSKKFDPDHFAQVAVSLKVNFEMPHTR